MLCRIFTSDTRPKLWDPKFDTNFGKIRYVVSEPKRNRSNFCLLLNFSHALAEKVDQLDGPFSVLSRLHGCKHKCAFC